MLAKQLSVFVENRQGRLKEVLKVLSDNEINIFSMSLADTTEYGVLRLIVDDYNLGRSKLTANGFTTMLSEVVIINIEHKPGTLQKLLDIISQNGGNVEYMYGLSSQNTSANVVLKFSDNELAERIFRENGVKTISVEEAVRG